MNNMVELKCPNCLDYFMPFVDMAEIGQAKFYDYAGILKVEVTVTVGCPLCENYVYEGTALITMNEKTD